MTTTEKTKYPMRDEYMTVGDLIRERTGQSELKTVADVVGGKIEFDYEDISNRLVLDHFTHDGCTVLVTLYPTHDEDGNKLPMHNDPHESNNCQVFIGKTSDIKNAIKDAAKEREDHPDSAEYILAKVSTHSGQNDYIELGSYLVKQANCRFCDWENDSVSVGGSEDWSTVCQADDLGQYGSSYQISRGAYCQTMPWRVEDGDLLDPFRYSVDRGYEDGRLEHKLDKRISQVFGYNVQHMSRSNRLWFCEYQIHSWVGSKYNEDDSEKRTVCPIIELCDESCIDDITIARDNWVDLNVEMTEQWIAKCKVEAKRKALSRIAEMKRRHAQELAYQALENVSIATALDVLTTQLATVLPNFNLDPELNESDLTDRHGNFHGLNIEGDCVKYKVTMDVGNKNISFAVYGEVTPGNYPEVKVNDWRSIGGGCKSVRPDDRGNYGRGGRCLESREHSSNKQCYDNGECRMSMAASFADTYDMGNGWGDPSRLREFTCMMQTMIAMQDQDFTTCK